MSEERITKPLAPIYKVLIGLIISFAPFMGCIFSIFVPYSEERARQDQAAQAEGEVQRIAEAVAQYYGEQCELPEDLPLTTDPSSCCGGQHCEFDAEALEAWKQAEIEVFPTVPGFAYQTREREGDYVVEGIADFRCDPSINHRYQVVLSAEGDCEVTIAAGRRINDFN